LLAHVTAAPGIGLLNCSLAVVAAPHAIPGSPARRLLPLSRVTNRAVIALFIALLVITPVASAAPLLIANAYPPMGLEPSPKGVRASDEPEMNVETLFLFDEWITWRDGSREHVQIARDGFVWLDGVRRRLVGFDLGTTGLRRAFWDKADLRVLEAELSYLESLGVRLIALDLFYVGKGREQERYTLILDMLFEHRMLVFPALIGKGLPGFSSLACGNSTLDFAINPGDGRQDTMGDWAERWLETVTSYRNVVALSIENELDVPHGGLSISGERLGDYLGWLLTLVRGKTNLPLTSKLTVEVNVRLGIKKTVLSLVDFPALDAYAYDLRSLELKLERGVAFLTANGRPQPTGYWIAELNTKTRPDPTITWQINSSRLTAAYLASAFAHGAGVVILYPANRMREPEAALFDAAGKPTSALLALSQYIHALS